MNRMSFPLILVLATSVGCSRTIENLGGGKKEMGLAKTAPANNNPAPPAGKVRAEAKEQQPVNLEAEAQDKKQIQRRIKYTARINLIADDFGKSEKQLFGLVEKYEGLLASTDVRVAPGSPRSGTWTVRIPVAKFNVFCEEAQQIAELQSQTRDSEDMTAEYNDLQVYIDGRKAELENLRKIMDKTSLTDNMKNFLEVRREMKAVEDDFNRKMGRLKLLGDLTDLTTITITIQERRKFDEQKPPMTVEQPDFGTRAAKSFGDSIESLQSFGAETAIFLIYIAPWAGLILAVALPIWLVELLRRRIRGKHVSADKPASPEPSGG